MSGARKQAEVVPSVQMPSADLINFRFDQTDKQFDELKEALAILGNNFATKEELATIKKQLDNFRWYWRAIVSAVFLALLTSFAGVLIHR